MDARDRGRAMVRGLGGIFAEGLVADMRPTYQKAHVRMDVLNSCFEAAGRDGDHTRGAPHVHADSVLIDDNGRSAGEKPGDAFGCGGDSREKPSLPLATGGGSACHIWNTPVPMANAEKLAAYDCRRRPVPTVHASLARRTISRYTAYIEKFDEIYAQRSRAVVFSEAFADRAPGALCIERSPGWLKPSLMLKAGAFLPQLIPSQRALAIHSGDQHLCAGQRGTSPCTLTLQVRAACVNDVQAWRCGAVPSRSVWRADHWRTQRPLLHGAVCALFVGLQTGADPVSLIVPEQETATHRDARRQASWMTEKSLRYPYDPSVPACAHASLLFSSALNRGSSEQRAFLSVSDEMQSWCPGCRRSLDAYTGRLDPSASERGQCSGKRVQGSETWYRDGRPQRLTTCGGRRRLTGPMRAQGARSAHAAGDIFFTGGGKGPYAMFTRARCSPSSLFSLQAIVHHPVCEAMIDSGSVQVRGEDSSRGKRSIAKGGKALVRVCHVVSRSRSHSRKQKSRRSGSCWSALSMGRSRNGRDDVRLVEDRTNMNGVLEKREKGFCV